MSDHLTVTATAHGARFGHKILAPLTIREHSVDEIQFAVDDDHPDAYDRLTFRLGGRLWNVQIDQVLMFGGAGSLNVTLDLEVIVSA